MKILCVEHDDDNLYVLKMRLERCGDFEVLAAEDSEQGCKLAVTEHPDVILIAGPGAFIGASDATQEGVWKWVTGPETGTTFWNGEAMGYRRTK
jgi:hypothetical protein